MRSINRFVQVVLAGLGIALSVAAYAGNAFGTVTSVTAELSASGGAFFVYLSVSDSSAPTSATQTNVFVLNPTTDIGKAQVAIVLVAKAAGTPVDIVGNNTFNITGSAEDILYVKNRRGKQGDGIMLSGTPLQCGAIPGDPTNELV